MAKDTAEPQSLSTTTTKTVSTQNESVYKATTKPKKPKRRDKSDLGPDFVAPDGGWGWVVCFAAGVSNLSIFPALQQYGLVYRQRLKDLGFDAKQTTTIINVVMAISSLVGIVNGALYRRFTFRQVGLFGSVVIFIGIFSSAFCTTFTQYIIFFACVYGIGLGLTMAAASLAVNTYFKNNRRRATAFSWTITGLGPIIFPHVSTFLLVYYGIQGTIILISGLALHAFLCAMTLQPVLWHVAKPEKPKLKPNAEELNICNTELNGNCINGIKITATSSGEFEKDDVNAQSDYECKYCQLKNQGKRRIFSSQHLFLDNDPNLSNYLVAVPDSPMMARANDGWFGSKHSLASEKDPRYRLKVLRQASLRDGTCADKLTQPKYFNYHRGKGENEYYASKQSVYSKAAAHDEIPKGCTCAEEKAFLQTFNEKELKLEAEQLQAAEEAEELAKAKMTFGEKIVKFFDLDLLKDFTFVNLAMGMTIMMFGEVNFSVLTPFILNSYGCTNEQISYAMSVLGGTDICVRFLTPFCLERIKFSNRVLFALGIITLTVGRFLITLAGSLNQIMVIFVLIGIGKGFRTIFSPLIIPSYVPLNRLPAASGLQLICNAVFSMTFGPILGVITDAFSYSATIHFINGLTCIALLLWLGEDVVRGILKKRTVETDS